VIVRLPKRRAKYTTRKDTKETKVTKEEMRRIAGIRQIDAMRGIREGRGLRGGRGPGRLRESQRPWDAQRRSRSRSWSLVAFAFVSFVSFVSLAPRLIAHDIPNDVTVQTFFKPEGQRLRVLVRVPLSAMRDIDYPKRGANNSGLLDLSRADATLRDAATLWISDFLAG